MATLWFEFTLTLRRLFRRRAQNGLLLLTFAISVTLSLLSWTLFRAVHLTHPEFDQDGEYLVLCHAGKKWANSGQLTLEEMEAYMAGQQVFSEMRPLGFYASVFVDTPTGNERLLAAFPSSSVLQLTGARPRLGQLFRPEDDKHRAPPKALLSERLWRDNYGSDPDIVGKTIVLFGDTNCMIVGVLPASYRFPNDQDIWVNYGTLFDGWRSAYATRTALVKLKPGVTRERAEQDLRTIRQTLPPETPTLVRNELPILSGYRQLFLLDDLNLSSAVLFALSLLFLAVSCANAANLMIVDFLGRPAQVAANLALGIPRRAAIRHLCWHVLLIALAAALVAALMLPLLGPALFERVKIVNGPYWLNYTFAASDVLVGLLIAGVSGIVTVTAPIAYLFLTDPEKLIRDHAYASRGTGRSVWRRLLLAGQVALLTVLAICSALLVRSSRNVGETRWGFDARDIFECKISNLSIEYPDGQWASGRIATQRQVLDEIRRRPATAQAAFVERPTGYSNNTYCTYALDPADFAAGGRGEAFYSQVTEGFFDVMRVPLLAGRDFTADLQVNHPPDVILTATLATRLWPNEDPLGRTLYARYPAMKNTDPPVRHVVRGVVRDFQVNGPRARTNDTLFAPWGGGSGDHAGSVTTYIRDHQGVATFRDINDAAHRAEPRVAVYFPSTLKRQIDLMLNSVRMTTDLTTVFAIAAFFLCAIGVYSLTVTQVLQSSREFGIRMALGAEPVGLWRKFTRGHVLTALVGVALGIAGTTQVIRVIQSLLFGVDARDPLTYAAVAGAILLVAALACLPSLRRMKRIHPADCLRSL